MIKRLFQFLWDVLEVFIIIYVIFVTSCILSKNRHGYTQFGKYTLIPMHQDDEEYIRDAKDGNLLLVKDDGNIDKNQVIFFYKPGMRDKKEIYNVRQALVTDKKVAETANLYTINDPEVHKVNSAKVVGNYSNQYPMLGKILEFLETRIGFLFFVLLPIMIVFVYQIYEFVIILNYEKVDKNSLIEEENARRQERIRYEAMKNKEALSKKDDIEIL